MKLTVGSLPPAVYWRRRVVIFGAVFALLLLMVYSCNNSSNAGPRAQPSGGPPVISTLPDESTPDPSSSQPTDEAPSQSASPDPSASGVGPLCADEDIAVAALPVAASARAGARVRLHLTISNTSARGCRRDVGADQQELRVMQGDQRLWSSDDCSPRHGANVRLIHPREKLTYFIDYDLRTSAPGCTQARSPLPAGTYQVVGRFGTKQSDPAPLTVR